MKRRKCLSLSTTSSTARNANVALVTGGSSGLGAGAAQCLALSGAKVMVADLSCSKSSYEDWTSKFLHDTAVQVIESNEPWDESKGCISFVAMDVTDTNQVSNALDTIEQRFGVVSPNIILNCAGTATARKTISLKNDCVKVHPVDDFKQTLLVNTIGTFLVSSLAAERMCRQQQEEGTCRYDSNYCIINTASIAAYEGQVGQVAYATSKGGIVSMTLPMARDLAPHKIRVMTIVRTYVYICQNIFHRLIHLRISHFCYSSVGTGIV